MIELSLKLNTVWVASNAGASWVGLCYEGGTFAKTNGPKQKLAGREVVMKAYLPTICWPFIDLLLTFFSYHHTRPRGDANSVDANAC